MDQSRGPCVAKLDEHHHQHHRNEPRLCTQLLIAFTRNHVQPRFRRTESTLWLYSTNCQHWSQTMNYPLISLPATFLHGQTKPSNKFLYGVSHLVRNNEISHRSA